jgi:hypothetical protein
MMQLFSSYSTRGQSIHSLALISCLVAFAISNSSAVFAQSPVIHVYEGGAYPYIGTAGLQQALLDVTDPGTIYVHSGTYDLGGTASSFLTISKALTLAGVDDGIGRPVIKGARPINISGVVFVDAPEKAVVLENLEISYYGKRPVGGADAVVYVRGSNSFTVQNCTITGAYFDGTNNQGIYASIRIEGIASSEFPALPYPLTPTSAPNPNYPLRYSVKGNIKIHSSTLTGWVGNILIGAFGPVSLDNIEISDCAMNVLGSTHLGNWNKGNAAVVVAQYPAYMTDLNRPILIEATNAGTQTVIKNNTMSASNLVALLYLKGVQLIEKNRLHSQGAWFRGKYNQWGIRATGYPHDTSDPATYSEAVIRDNVIDLQVPPFPIPGALPFAPPQTSGNTSPPTGIWLGASNSFYYALSSITGHYAKATVTGNIISSTEFSPSGPINYPDYGLYLAAEMKDCVIARNYLAGGTLRDPIDGQARPFNSFTAKISQVQLESESHGIAFQENRFGPATVAGVMCYGHNNWFVNNYFYGNYAGWEPGPGLFWLKNTSYGNLIVAAKLDAPPFSFDICRQIRDETGTVFSGYNGLNIIPGFERCGR